MNKRCDSCKGEDHVFVKSMGEDICGDCWESLRFMVEMFKSGGLFGKVKAEESAEDPATK